jgi:hypothetical protein
MLDGWWRSVSSWPKSCAAGSEDHHRVTQRRETTPQVKRLSSDDELGRHMLDPGQCEAVLGWLAEMAAKAARAEGGNDDRSREDPARAS